MKNGFVLSGWFLAALLLVGCGREGTDPAVIEGVSKLPGASNVLAAVDRKDYAGAMAALTKVKESVTTDEQNIHFMVLAKQARDKISEAAATNAEAAQAVMVLRALSTGGGR
jgi:hypothetical protein